MSFMADVQTDQQCRDLFDDAHVFQLAAINGTHSRNLCCQFAGELCRVGIITADNDITIDRIIAIEQVRREIVKRRDHADSLGNQLRGLLHKLLRAIDDT